MSNKRKTGTGILVALAILLAAIGLWRFFQPGHRKPTEHVEASKAEPAAPNLSAALHKLRGELEWPGHNVREAAEQLPGSQAILDFVMDGVAYIPYRGQWCGAEGALRTRTANSIDKALLLQALLKAKGYATRIVRADPPPNASPYAGKQPARDLPALQEVRAFLTPSVAPPVAPLAAAERDRRLDQIRAERDATTAAVSDLLMRSHSSLRLDEIPDAKTLGDLVPAVDSDWVWVEAREHYPGRWITLDPMYPSLPRPAAKTVDFVPVPSRLSIELAAALPDGRAQSLVRWEGMTEDALGHDISLSFLPGIADMERLTALTDPAQVGLWCPVLQVGPRSQRGAAFSRSGALLTRRSGAIQLEGEPVLEESEMGAPARTAPISKLAITSVDASQYPRVRVRMAVEALQRPVWRHTLFDARDPGAATARLPVTIESASVERRPVFLVVDTSGSMNDQGRLAMAKLAMTRLISRLDPEQPVGLIGFSSSVSVLQKRAPLKSIRESLLKQIEGLTAGGDTSIMEAVQSGISEIAGSGCIVLLTDGQDGGKGDTANYANRIAQTNAALAASRCTVYAVGIGEADDALLENFARVSGTPYIHASDPAHLPALYASMATSLSGGVVTSIHVRPSTSDRPGRAKQLRIAMTGYDKPVVAAYQIPSKSASSGSQDRRLILKVQIQEGAQPAPRSYVRTLFKLGPKCDSWTVLASYHLGFSIAPMPNRVIASRQIDEAIDLQNMQAVQQGAALPKEYALQRGLGSRSARLMSAAMLTLPGMAEAGTTCQWRGPTLLLETSRMIMSRGEIARRQTIDFLATCYGPDTHATRHARAAWGAALGAVEASLVGGKSVNQMLLERQVSLKVAAATQTAPSLVNQFSAGGGFTIRSPACADAVWSFAPCSELYPVLIGETEGKGASVVQIAAEFKRLRNLLQLLGAAGSGTLSLVGAPGSVWTALCSFFDEELKLWCYSSVMLGFVEEAIETGSFDVGSSEAWAAKHCELSRRPDNFAKNLVNAITSGFAGGVAEDAAGTWISGLIDGPPITSGITSGIISYEDPIPGWGADFLNDVTAQVSPTSAR